MAAPVVLVLNAGSSSLKFCVYRCPEHAPWTLEARGNIEGIGTAPRFVGKDGSSRTIEDRALGDEVRDARAALGTLAGWLRDRFQGSTVLGVGHRVVHGGPRFDGPIVMTPEVMQTLRALVPLAPLHQPHNLAAIDA